MIRMPIIIFRKQRMEYEQFAEWRVCVCVYRTIDEF